jgi:hypothetical protein
MMATFSWNGLACDAGYLPGTDDVSYRILEAVPNVFIPWFREQYGEGSIDPIHADYIERNWSLTPELESIVLNKWDDELQEAAEKAVEKHEAS